MQNNNNINKNNLYYLNHEVLKINPPEGVEILLSKDAYYKYSWTKKYFEGEPKDGYFIWVKKQPKTPLLTCVALSQKNIVQKMQNLLVIESDIKAVSNVSCAALQVGLCGKHFASGKIILKERSSLKYDQFHTWGQNDYVEPNYEFYLEKNSRLEYHYQLLKNPHNLNIHNRFYLKENASIYSEVVIEGIGSQININEEMVLEGKNSQGALYLRLVASKKSKIRALSKITSLNESKGHLDCRGLLLDKQSMIALIPELDNRNPKSSLTHEAYIGKINNDEINYLRTRGLTQKEAINLIVNGFLKITNDKE
ncbi:MAG: SufB/SufD family protein [Minisyncoccia bacterium]